MQISMRALPYAISACICLVHVALNSISSPTHMVSFASNNATFCHSYLSNLTLMTFRTFYTLEFYLSFGTVARVFGQCLYNRFGCVQCQQYLSYDGGGLYCLVVA